MTYKNRKYCTECEISKAVKKDTSGKNYYVFVVMHYENDY